MQQTAVKYGIISGTASALYLFLFHQMGAAFVLNPFVVFGQIFISLFGAVLAVRAIREANAGKIDKKLALKYGFTVFALSQFLFWVFIYLLFNFIDTNIIDIGSSFREYVLRINKNAPSKEFAETFLDDSSGFLAQAFDWRKLNKVA